MATISPILPDTPSTPAPTLPTAPASDLANTSSSSSTAAITGTPHPIGRRRPEPRFQTGEHIDPRRDERAGLIREVGCQAIWSLSTCKPGFGVDQLRDQSLENYWQSDGQLPHLVNIQFRRKMTVRDICIYTDFRLDESYTPSKISVRCGTHFNDLQEVEVVEVTEPSGWVQIFLKDIRDRPICTFMLQLAVLSNHQNGRDTHLRQIRIHSPVENLPVAVFPGNFTGQDTLCTRYSCIR